MSWFKMDDQLYGHKKTRRAGVEAMGLWAICGAWSAAHEEDGFVPDYVAESFTPRAQQYAKRLVSAGFWSDATKDGDKGWQFHGWDEYQPTSEQQDAKRERWREWKRNSRSRREVSTPDIQDSQRGVSVESAESKRGVSLPRPDPTRPGHLTVSEPVRDVRTAKRPVPKDWQPNDHHREVATVAGLNIAIEAENFLNHHAAKGNQFADWDRAFNTWLNNAKKWRAEADARAGVGPRVVTAANGTHYEVTW